LYATSPKTYSLFTWLILEERDWSLAQAKTAVKQVWDEAIILTDVAKSARPRRRSFQTNDTRRTNFTNSLSEWGEISKSTNFQEVVEIAWKFPEVLANQRSGAIIALLCRLLYLNQFINAWSYICQSVRPKGEIVEGMN